jgi:hypothetical protein
MRQVVLLLAALAIGCGMEPLVVPPRDTVADERPCTTWGSQQVCNDAGLCGRVMICLSYVPQPCPPGPWKCPDGGALSP